RAGARPPRCGAPARHPCRPAAVRGGGAPPGGRRRRARLRHVGRPGAPPRRL
ncbi:MAG: hypothetical protein AVDCRST_MAG13-1841, partial [uncultured Solirubrobacteraceae bacterium]